MTDVLEQLKNREIWWLKVHDYIIEKRDEAHGTEWFGRLNAIAHSVRGRTPVEDAAVAEITRLRTALAASEARLATARDDALEEAARFMETRFALGVGDYAAVKIRALKDTET